MSVFNRLNVHFRESILFRSALDVELIESRNEALDKFQGSGFGSMYNGMALLIGNAINNSDHANIMRSYSYTLASPLIKFYGDNSREEDHVLLISRILPN